MKSDRIIIRGARQHNLKNIDVDFPKNKLVIITGLSGSGKSSLAFDTLYAEGQRRYVESLSTYARQFLGRMDKPDVDTIDGLSPAIAIEQKTASHNPRSTVGTVTEIYDYLRLLYARVGKAFCHQCGSPISSITLDQVADKVMTLPEGKKIIILSPLKPADKDEYEKLLARLRKDGFARIRIDGETLDIDEPPPPVKRSCYHLDVIVDRLVTKNSMRNRLSDSLELATSLSEGFAAIDILPETDDENGETILFSEKASCAKCDISYPEFTPASFSFNSPSGACEKCDGIGTSEEFDPDLIIPNSDLSLREGAVAVWENRSSVQFFEFMDALTTCYGVDIHTPYKDLPARFKRVLLNGSGKKEIPFYFERDGQKVTYNKTYEGVIPNLKKRYKESTAGAREEISKYISLRPCTRCGGTRLNTAGRSVRVGELTIGEFTALSIDRALDHISGFTLSEKDAVIANSILNEVKSRLEFLKNVGLSYLTLSRTASTLSGGESQRIRLATQIGSKLSGVLYVLDEPSIGLHQRDNLRLLQTLKQIRDLGNTVLVVEHDEETILSSDHIIDMGPAAGINGGEVMFSGTPAELLRDERSLTGQYFSGKRCIELPEKRRAQDRDYITLFGAKANNLKNVDISLPIGCFTCVTGVSGSGKSTLILSTLYKALAQKLYQAKVSAGEFTDLKGTGHINKVIDIDQSAIGKTPRSNPATYTGVFTGIRELFCKTPDARARGYKSGRFSFNMKGGRCEACGGDGTIKIEMHFLPDVYVTCDVCRGKRYNRETLEIKYKGKNISEVLNMTVNQGLKFFSNVPGIAPKLQTLVDVGLGYIHLGQAATTLSGGEAQRIKLAKELSNKGTGRTVYILDEPTTGLHIEDIRKLLDVLNRLVDAGNTIIVIEHNLDVIKCADHVIDLGPEGGDQGGMIVGAGTPEEIAALEESHTGHFLKQVLKQQ